MIGTMDFKTEGKPADSHLSDYLRGFFLGLIFIDACYS
ncbi:hypothetical protein IGI44_003979 [Enterococcus sp. DIV0756]